MGIALAFLRSKGLELVNIDATNIVSGNPTLTLGMIWIIILKFQVMHVHCHLATVVVLPSNTISSVT